MLRLLSLFNNNKFILFRISKSSLNSHVCYLGHPKQIIKYNRWQQRNRPIIDDVTSIKYNKEDDIFSHKLTCFPRLNKKV